MIKKHTLILLCTITFIQSESEYHQQRIITVPVADLRAKPEANPINLKLPTSDILNPLQITQLLCGEHICAHEEFMDAWGTNWLRVNTLQQEYYYDPLQWHGYPGWVQEDQTILVQSYPQHNLVVNQQHANICDEDHHIIATLSIGTRLCGEKQEDLWQITLPNNTTAFIKNSDVYYLKPIVDETAPYLRQSIVSKALEFVGYFYSWGGRSSQNEDLSISSVDCSALVGLSFLAHGLQLPRMSHEQWLRSEKIDNGAHLQPGDLVFFTTLTKQATRMDHVMLYIADNMLLEATYADEHTSRIISFDQRLGQRPEALNSGDIVEVGENIFQIYFGTFLNNPELIQTLRNHALRTEYEVEFMNKKNIFNDLNYLRFH